MSMNSQNKRYKEDTLGSEITPEDISSIQSYLNPVFLESFHKSGQEISRPGLKEYLFSQESDVTEFHFDRDDQNIMVNLASCNVIEEEKPKKTFEIDDSVVQCSWWCFDLESDSYDDKCNII